MSYQKISAHLVDDVFTQVKAQPHIIGGELSRPFWRAIWQYLPTFYTHVCFDIEAPFRTFS